MIAPFSRARRADPLVQLRLLHALPVPRLSPGPPCPYNALVKSSGSRRPARIGDVLKERIAALGWEPRLREEEVVTGWDAAVGPQIAAHARPSHVVNRRLTVVTASPVWTQQLALLKPELLRRIAGRFGRDVVTDLYFVTGRIDPAAAPRARRARRARAPPPTCPRNSRASWTASSDVGVRDAVRRLILAALADGGPRP